MLDMLLAIVVGSFGAVASEIIIIAAILVVLFVILKLGKFIIGLLLNSILGLVAIWLVNSFFGLGIVFTLITWILVAIFGLPAVAVIIILKLLGISLP